MIFHDWLLIWTFLCFREALVGTSCVRSVPVTMAVLKSWTRTTRVTTRLDMQPRRSFPASCATKASLKCAMCTDIRRRSTVARTTKVTTRPEVRKFKRTKRGCLAANFATKVLLTSSMFTATRGRCTAASLRSCESEGTELFRVRFAESCFTTVQLWWSMWKLFIVEAQNCENNKLAFHILWKDALKYMSLMKQVKRTLRFCI